ncbi:hypothetical protein EW145_g1358 [Phellinidium pouzarii]|uniref:DUF6534 domain-containing protein n=1 Tax=Phellinidium pouzarii TaxID=167371 RepID=A0A4S4LF34_9AGAM|nr:hypothetical protein EW145_g1358 [Phellinidium pouzarii]
MNDSRTFNALFSGFVLSATLYALISQYRHSNARTLLLTVRQISLLWTLDTVSTGLLSHTLSTYLITNFGFTPDVLHLTRGPSLISANWLLGALQTEVTLTVIVIFIVHLFYATRIWSVSKNVIVLGVIALSAVITFVFGIAQVSIAQLFKGKTVFAFFHGNLKTFMGLNTGFAFLCDVVITSTLCFYLPPLSNSEANRHQMSVERAIVYVFNRGIIVTLTASIVQFTYFLTFITSPAQQIWFPFSIFIARVYVNALLATLNFRQAHAGRGIHEEQSSSACAAATSTAATAPASAAYTYQLRAKSSPLMIINNLKASNAPNVPNATIGTRRMRRLTALSLSGVTLPAPRPARTTMDTIELGCLYNDLADRDERLRAEGIQDDSNIIMEASEGVQM